MQWPKIKIRFSWRALFVGINWAPCFEYKGMEDNRCPMVQHWFDVDVCLVPMILIRFRWATLGYVAADWV